MLLKDSMFVYIMTIKKLFASLPFIARQLNAKFKDVNRIVHVSNFLNGGGVSERQIYTISYDKKPYVLQIIPL